MASSDQTKIALDESRMLMLGAQILLGFQLHAPFQNAFDDLTLGEKTIELAVLCIMVLVLGLLVAPSARHRIVERGEASAGFNRFVTRMSLVTLLPFAIAFALDLAIAGMRVAGPWTGAAAGLAGGVMAVGFWYGSLMIRNKEPDMPEADSGEKTPTAAKIDFVLTETRVVLPGAQALLGFQLAIVLTSGFTDLPVTMKAVHGVALGLIALTTILLMTPAAYHRIVYGGADVSHFYRVASRFLLAATVFLALGLSAEIWVVVNKITENGPLANALALATAATLFGFWHIWPCWRRWRKLRAG